MKNKIISAVVIIIVIAAGWYALSHKKSSNTPVVDPSQAVATVNGQKITRSKLDVAEAQLASQQGVTSTSTETLKAIETQALDTLVAQELVRQAAASTGITASTTEVETQLASMKGQFQTPDAYTQALAAQGLTEADLRNQISDGIAIQTYLDKELNLSAITATDAEIQTAYDQAVAGQANVPALADVKDQVKQLVIQQKQQQLIDAQVSKLRAAADVQILI